jgi:60 kDa SS-A/Ro ribonucleoprotein
MQVIKYPKRTAEEGNSKSSWSHKDLLRKAHPTGDANHNLIYDYITKDGKLPKTVPSDLKILEGANLMKEATTEKEVVRLIEKYELPHEVIPKEFTDKKDVWEALLPNMPMTATLRTLNRLTSYGVLAPLSSNTKFVVERLTNADEIQKARVHPIAVLAALKTYSSGRGIKGGLTWNPIPQISNALDEMLYMAFDAVEPTGKNILIGLDISGSMDMGGIAGLDFITPREGAAVMAMVTARSEKNYHMIAFTSGGGDYNGSSGVTVFNVSPKDRLDTVVDRMKRMDVGRTDCAIPPMYALKNKLDVDAFITLTDNETYAGTIKPSEAVNRYRKERNKPTAKMLAVGMNTTEYSIADPNDKYSLNFVGFDSSAPSLMADFIRKP